MYFALVNGFYLDGHADMQPQSGKAIIIRDGIIESIIPESEVPRNCPHRDLDGSYVLPGLINLHLHIPAGGKPSKKPKNYAALAKLLKYKLARTVVAAVCRKNVQQDLLSGTTTVRAVGGVPGFDIELRDRINAGKAVGPRILTSDYAVSVPGGHMTGSVALPAHSPEEAAAMVEAIAAQKPDLIKLMITGGVLDAAVPGEPGVLKMPPAYVKAACDKAHEFGLPVAAHVESTEGMLVALQNGVDTLEHGGKPTPEVISLMKEKGAVLVATLSPAIPFAAEPGEFIGVTETGHVNGLALYHNMLECIAACRKEGIPVGLGTDTGCPYVTHYDFWREIWYYSKLCGVSPAEALHTATEVNARILGLDGEIGTLDAGKKAELIIVSDNPLEDPETLQYPETVIFGDRFFPARIKRIRSVEKKLSGFMRKIEQEGLA